MSSSGFSPVASSPSVPPWGTQRGEPPPPIPAAHVVVFTFTQADLVAHIFTAVHNLGNAYVTFQIYDNTGSALLPDAAVAVDANTLAVTLTNFEPIPGTWHLVVVG